MSNALTYPDEKSAILDNFGIFHLNLEDAAFLISKCLWFNGDLTITFDDELYYETEKETELKKLLQKEIQKFGSVLIRAIDEGKLKPKLVKRDLSENLLTNETYIEAHDLAEFLQERGIEIYGDTFTDYADEQSELIEIAVNTIRFGKRADHQKIDSQTKGYILHLEGMIENFGRGTTQINEESMSAKSRQIGTLLKLIIGMAKDAYGYDPCAARSPFPKELEGILDQQGLSVSDDTIRKWLKEASELLPPEQSED